MVNDKALHLATFFALTVAFYWIVDTNRRRTLNLTLVACTLVLGVGSELLQALLPNDRAFDLYDVVANVVGSLAGLGLCSWYHKRMLERRRQGRSYGAVPGEDEEDLELGEGGSGSGSGSAAAAVGGAIDDGDIEPPQEEGIVAVGGTSSSGTAPAATATATTKTTTTPTLEDEVDNWDENAVDAWDEDDDGDVGVASGGKGKAVEANGGGDRAEPKKRTE